MKPIVTSSEIIHQNPWYQIRHDKLIWPNGKPGNYYVNQIPPAPIIIAVQDGHILTVSQYRYTLDQTTIELPMGGSQKGENAQTAALRELEEETGYRALEIKQLGVVWRIIGSNHSPLHVFFTNTLEKVAEQHLDDSEDGMNAEWRTLADWEALIKNGTVCDSDSVAAYGLYLLHSKQ